MLDFGRCPVGRGIRFANILHLTSNVRLQGSLSFLWQLCENDATGLAYKSLDFRARQGVFGFERHPLRPGEVGGGDNSHLLHQPGKILGSALERQPMISRLERQDGIHLSRNLKNQVAPPLDRFRSVRKGEAVLP